MIFEDVEMSGLGRPLKTEGYSEWPHYKVLCAVHVEVRDVIELSS